MKNPLLLLLVLLCSLPVLAQQNELVLAPAYVRYHASHSTFSKKTGHVFDANGSGYQLGLTYLRNIYWLQIGGSIEVGKLNAVNDKAHDPTGRHTVGDPYAVFNALVNGRLVVRKWTFTGGVCGGYMVSAAYDVYSFSGSTEPSWKGGRNYNLSGIYKGGQLGVSYKLHPKLSLSTGFTARFTRLKQSGLDTNGNFNAPPFNRLNMYNFGVGVHYKL